MGRQEILEKPPVEYQMLVHLFGATSSPSCAGFAIHKTVQENKRDCDEGVAKTVFRTISLWMDCLKSVSSETRGQEAHPSAV